jgi:hypothetical protein
MQLIQARLAGSPREVSTKYGQKAVADAIDGQGNKHTIWRNPGDLNHLTNGSVVELAIDSKGKVSLIDREPQPRAMGFSTEQPYRTLPQTPELPTAPETTRSAEIADYINRLGKLYSHCLTTAANMPTAIELEAPQIKDVATTIFIQTVRHFDL